MSKYGNFIRGLTAFCLVMFSIGPAISQTGGSGPADETGQAKWAAAWGAAMYKHTWSRLPEPRLQGRTTLRFILRTQYGGEQVRIRLGNVHGSAPIQFEDAWIGIRQHGPGIVPGTHQPVLFKGNQSPLIQPGEYMMSDPVNLEVRAFEELAVSFYIEEPMVITDYHRKALVTSYMQTGNMAAAEIGPTEPARLLGEPYPFSDEFNYIAWVDLLEVKTADSAGVIVAFGDSITDGSCAPDNAYASWPDLLTQRIYAGAMDKPYKSVINMGIGGNTLEEPQMAGLPGVSRIHNDVLKLSNVTDVVIWMGTNDLSLNSTDGKVLDGYARLVTTARQHGLNTVGVTMIPRRWSVFDIQEEHDQNERDGVKERINAAIRDGKLFDHYIDADHILRDPDDENNINKRLNCDDIHPTAMGYKTFAESIDLSIFDDK